MQKEKPVSRQKRARLGNTIFLYFPSFCHPPEFVALFVLEPPFEHHLSVASALYSVPDERIERNVSQTHLVVVQAQRILALARGLSTPRRAVDRVNLALGSWRRRRRERDRWSRRGRDRWSFESDHGRKRSFEMKKKSRVAAPLLFFSPANLEPSSFSLFFRKKNCAPSFPLPNFFSALSSIEKK